MIQPTDPPDLWTLIRMNTYLICWVITEIPRLSHAAPEQYASRYSVHTGTLQSASSIFCILVLNIGPVPKTYPSPVMEITPMITGTLSFLYVKTGHSLFLTVG